MWLVTRNKVRLEKFLSCAPSSSFFDPHHWHLYQAFNQISTSSSLSRLRISQKNHSKQPFKVIHSNCPSHLFFLLWGGSFVWRGADMSGCLNPDLTSTTSHTDLLISHFSYSKSTQIVKSVPQGSQMCQKSGDWGVQARRNGRPLTWIVSSYMRTRDTQHLGFFVVVGMTLAWVYHAQRIWISKCLCSALQHTWLLYSFLYNACLVVLSFSLAVAPRR